jgi:transcriptional regulator with XRE-family HTH domain
VYYELIDPEQVEQELRKSTKKLTAKDIATRIGVDPGALSRALNGQRVWASTIEAIAEAIGKDPPDIARESRQ